MAKRINRMQFLRGDFKGKSPLRPPWAVSENQFVDLCSRCDDCIDACPSNIIKRGASGFPEMDFSRSGCDFCQACVRSCSTGSLSINQSNHEYAWDVTAQINEQCLSARGVVCRSCGDVCESQAIRFKLVVGGSAMIQMNSSACNGCGDCVSLCPVQAIEMKPGVTNTGGAPHE